MRIRIEKSYEIHYLELIFVFLILQISLWKAGFPCHCRTLQAIHLITGEVEKGLPAGQELDVLSWRNHCDWYAGLMVYFKLKELTAHCFRKKIAVSFPNIN